jgi:cytochrome P450
MDTADLVTALAKPLPLAVTARMLGLPDDPRMDEWAAAFINFGVDPDGGLRASRELTAVLSLLVAERRASPREDLISLVANAEVEGERLSDEDVCTFARMLFPAGADTTYMAMSNLFALLLSEPQRWDRCVEEPGSRPLLVEEALRFEAPLVSMARVARHDGDFRGHPVPAGAMVLLCLGMANRQPDVYADADRYAPDRWGPGHDTRPHVSFGYGDHFCLGAAIARAEMTAALDVLAERRPRIDLAAPIRMLGSLMRRPDEVQVHL